MKKYLLLSSISVVILLSACVGTLNPKHSSTHETTKLKSIMITQSDDSQKGGNPEVYIAHNCLKNKESLTCLEQLFSDERKVHLQSIEIIKLAGRGTKVEERVITFKDDDLFLLYLDTSNVTKPLSINISSAQTSSDNNSILFILPVKNINEEIIIKDKKGNVILKYKVHKE